MSFIRFSVVFLWDVVINVNNRFLRPLINCKICDPTGEVVFNETNLLLLHPFSDSDLPTSMQTLCTTLV